jgi:hypothetical protein
MEFLRVFRDGFVAGIKIAPYIFIAPIVAIKRLLSSTADSLLHRN